MKILIIGFNGQLGIEMMRSCPKDWQVSGFDMRDINVTYVDQVNQVTGDCGPDRVINCASHTSVDKAESEPGTAYAVNCDGTANLTLAAKK
jgi:dTDP-4-dehydrorhamnose reductase